RRRRGRGGRRPRRRRACIDRAPGVTVARACPPILARRRPGGAGTLTASVATRRQVLCQSGGPSRTPREDADPPRANSAGASSRRETHPREVAEQMATGIGETLRAARHQRGRTIADAAAATRVREYYLAALEQDDFAALGGDVYVKGFLLRHAKYLGLDPD